MQHYATHLLIFLLKMFCMLINPNLKCSVRTGERVGNYLDVLMQLDKFFQDSRKTTSIYSEKIFLFHERTTA